MNPRFYFGLLMAMILWVTTTQAQSTLVLNAEQLEQLSTGNRPVNLIGDRLVFGRGLDPSEQLFELQSIFAPERVIVRTDVECFQADCDYGVAISDGSSALTVIRGDNFNGLVDVGNGIDNGTGFVIDVPKGQSQQGLEWSNPCNSTINVKFRGNLAEIIVENNDNGRTAKFEVEHLIDMTQQLRIYGIAGDPHESYGYRTVESTVFLSGDINCDGVVDLLDVSLFVELLSNGEFNPKADLNGDSAVNLLDVQPFVEVLVGP